MHFFGRMFSDDLNEERVGWSLALISKKGNGVSLYEHERAWLGDSYYSIAHDRVRIWAEVTECSVWTVNPDGSLNDKLATFFKPMKE